MSVDNFDETFNDHEKLRFKLLLKTGDPDFVDKLMQIYKIQYPNKFKK